MYAYFICTYIYTHGSTATSHCCQNPRPVVVPDPAFASWKRSAGPRRHRQSWLCSRHRLPGLHLLLGHSPSSLQSPASGDEGGQWLPMHHNCRQRAQKNQSGLLALKCQVHADLVIFTSPFRHFSPVYSFFRVGVIVSPSLCHCVNFLTLLLYCR